MLQIKGFRMVYSFSLSFCLVFSNYSISMTREWQVVEWYISYSAKSTGFGCDAKHSSCQTVSVPIEYGKIHWINRNDEKEEEVGEKLRPFHLRWARARVRVRVSISIALFILWQANCFIQASNYNAILSFAISHLLCHYSKLCFNQIRLRYFFFLLFNSGETF